MKRSRFTEEQIIGILKAAEASGNARAVCQEHNISEQTFYRWRRKYEGMDVSEARKLRELERENQRLKRLVADQAAPSLRGDASKTIAPTDKAQELQVLSKSEFR